MAQIDQLERLRSGETKSIRLAVKQFLPLQTKAITSPNLPAVTECDPTIYGTLPRANSTGDLLRY